MQSSGEPYTESVCVGAHAGDFGGFYGLFLSKIAKVKIGWIFSSSSLVEHKVEYSLLPYDGRSEMS